MDNNYPAQEFVWWEGVCNADTFNNAKLVELVAHRIAAAIMRRQADFTAMDYVDASGTHRPACDITIRLNGVRK